MGGETPEQGHSGGTEPSRGCQRVVVDGAERVEERLLDEVLAQQWQPEVRRQRRGERRFPSPRRAGYQHQRSHPEQSFRPDSSPFRTIRYVRLIPSRSRTAAVISATAPEASIVGRFSPLSWMLANSGPRRRYQASPSASGPWCRVRNRVSTSTYDVGADPDLESALTLQSAGSRLSSWA